MLYYIIFYFIFNVYVALELRIINFLSGEKEPMEKKLSSYKRLYLSLRPQYTRERRNLWVSGGESVTGLKKDWATEKSRVTNGVNSSTRNSLIGVSDISFREMQRERGVREREPGHENHQLTIVLRVFLRERHCSARRAGKNSVELPTRLILLTSLFLKRSRRNALVTNEKLRERNNPRRSASNSYYTECIVKHGRGLRSVFHRLDPRKISPNLNCEQRKEGTKRDYAW